MTRILSTTVALLVMFSTSAVLSDPGKEPDKSDSRKTNRKPGAKPPAKSRRALEVTPEREAAALTFVKQHHPELSELLMYLKEKRNREYQRAVRELFRNSEGLAVIRDRDEERYRLELAVWKNKSRVQLISARFRMEQTDELRRQLQVALQQQVQRKLDVMNFEKQRLQQRVKKLDDQMNLLKKSQAQIVNSRMQSLAGKKTRSKPSSKTTPDKTTKKNGPARTPTKNKK